MKKIIIQFSVALLLITGIYVYKYNNEKDLEVSNISQDIMNDYEDIIIKHGNEDEKVYLNMEFLGLDLNKVPMQNLSDPKVYIIPILYILSTFISISASLCLSIPVSSDNSLSDIPILSLISFIFNSTII